MKYLYLILSFLLLTSCTKEDTCQDCLETFQCKINGEKWSPQCDGYPDSWCPDIDCQYYIEDGGLIFRVENDTRNDRLLFSTYAPSIGVFGVLGNSRHYINFTLGNCGGYGLIKNLPNRLELTHLDTINSTVEGNFAFSVLGECDGDTLHITDGYFHLSYRF